MLPWLGIAYAGTSRPTIRRAKRRANGQGNAVPQNAGAHHTPKSLAREVVLHALQPLCYSPGPYQTADESQWRLKSSDDLLSLKVADIACGSGAFLVSAASYLADRVVEAWTAEDPANAHAAICTAVPSARWSAIASMVPTSTTWPSKCANFRSG